MSAMVARAGIMDPKALEFLPGLLAIESEPPAPLPRAMLAMLLLLLAAILIWITVGQLDIIAVAEGKLVPATYLKIVQPAEGGILKEILVNEGDRVTADQVLIRMDARISEADTRIIETGIAQRVLQVQRIDAELHTSSASADDDADGDRVFHPGRDAGLQSPGTATPISAAGIPAEMRAQAEAQYEAHRSAYRAALGTERAALLKAKEELAAAVQVQSKLEALLPTYQQEEAALEQLGKSQLVAQLDVIERRRKRIEIEQDLRAQERTVQSLKALITQSVSRLAQITSQYREQLHNERVEAQSQLDKLVQERAKQQHRNTLLELKAPQDAIVKDLATHTPGAVVSPGTVLLTLVPANELLRAEVMIRNQDIGFVHEGQRAKIKLTAFPFQKYGMIEGVVSHVSADASAVGGDTSADEDAREAGTPVDERRGGLVYKAIVQLQEQRVSVNGMVFTVAPGMQVTAEIHQGRRTVLEYLLSPVQRIAHDAFRER